MYITKLKVRDGGETRDGVRGGSQNDEAEGRGIFAPTADLVVRSLGKWNVTPMNCV